jgi:hypothetical protein
LPAGSITGSIVSGQLAANLTLGGTTSGSFSGALAGNATNVTGVVAIANGGTGSAVQNFVDLASNQTTIGGTKAFTGNVGIGTSGPAAPLHVNNGAFLLTGAPPALNLNGAGKGLLVSTTAFGDPAVFMSASDFDNFPATPIPLVLQAANNGKVGIGTGNPSVTLDVAATGDAIHGTSTVFGAGVKGTGHYGVCGESSANSPGRRVWR